ncbi:MAG: nitrous oxide reductase accessory protein NosL [Deltaproteobacteria bacterium]|nr:nitrous oxide reductase accessory protein NosL [Deltaproteobacteria bacterium]
MVSAAGAETISHFKIKSTDKCPVCGMFVAKYTDFIAYMTFKDGSHAAFDGVKDMMKCYLDMSRYLPGKKRSDIRTMAVTDYYTMRMIDALTAYYVTGSDVLGPMGHELIPHESQAKAKEFMEDHLGKKMLTLPQITPAILKELDP